MFALVILPPILALVVLAPARKSRICEELADFPKRYRRCLVGSTNWVLEDVAARVTVLPLRLIFISGFLSNLECRTCPDAQAQVLTSIVWIITVCR